MNSSSSFTENPLDFESISIEAIPLEPFQIEQALQIGNQIPNATQHWKTYLNALALLSFHQWLNNRAPELSLVTENCTILQPAYANILEAVCQLSVGEFKLCLVTTGSLNDEEISVPRAVIDLPEFAAHFYVWLEIQEEAELAIIRGFLRHDQLIQRTASTNLQPQSDWSYSLPVTWFENHSDTLLLYLRCLEPRAIPLPEIPRYRLAALSEMQAELIVLLPRLQSPNRPLWEVLTWEQGIAVLTNRELVNWLYQLQNSAATIQELEVVNRQVNYLPDLLQLLTQQAVNVARWLRDEMDELAQGFSWLLLPALAETSSLRSTPGTFTGDSPTEEIEAIVHQLTNAGIMIPATARGAYQDLRLVQVQVRLYALTWPNLSPENVPEWTLLLVLAPLQGNTLPEGICLRVSDPTGILVERQLNANSSDIYLYVLIAGQLDERFLARVILADGTSLTLPPFAFVP